MVRIRRCPRTLKLQTQAGECAIEHIGEIKGLGTLWFYSAGISNILSQFKMATCSRWQMSCDTSACSRTGYVRELCCNVINNGGRKYKFVPTRNDLHALVLNEQSANAVFGEHLTDNGT